MTSGVSAPEPWRGVAARPTGVYDLVVAWWRASIPPGPVLAVLLVAIGCGVATGCGDAKQHEARPMPSAPAAPGVSRGRPAASTSAPAASTAGPSASTADRGATAVPAPSVDAAPTAPRSPGDDGFGLLDLGPAGEAWVGMIARAPAGATVSGDGSGGALVFLGPGRTVVLSASSGAIADHRLGATTASRVIEGTIAFSTDTPQEIAYEQRGTDRDGQPLRTWGFATTVQLGRAKVVCAHATARDERELAAARAVCSSLARR